VSLSGHKRATTRYASSANATIPEMAYRGVMGFLLDALAEANQPERHREEDEHESDVNEVHGESRLWW
jgi:hypothetical protein